MNLVTMTFYTIFGANIMLEWGLIPGLKKQTGSRLLRLVIFPLLAAAIAILNFMAFRLFLQPSGLLNLMPVLNAVLLITGLGLWYRITVRRSGAKLKLTDFIGRPVPVSLILYTGILSTASSDPNPLSIGLTAFCAILAYFAALAVVTDIMERLELVDMPQAFRGYPALFLSVALVALAFAGVQQTFFSNLFTK